MHSGAIVPLDFEKFEAKKNGPPEGDPLNPMPVERVRRNFVKALRAVGQSRAAVLELMTASRALADIAALGGDSFAAAESMRERLAANYAQAWAVYEAAGPSEIGDAFDAIFGVTIGELETALEAVGWHLAAPETRLAIGPRGGWHLTIDGVRANV